jgi:hypothetical protein
VQPGLRVAEPAGEAVIIQHALPLIDDVADAATSRIDAEQLHLALARLAAGRFERVLPLLRRAAPSRALPLITARYVAWTGDLPSAAAAWQHVRSATEALFADRASASVGTGSTDAWLRSATAIELQRTAADLGDPTLAAALHRHARDSSGQAQPAGWYAPAGTAMSEAAAAARAVLRFVHDTLGVEPDATRHRLRLSPLLRSGADLNVRDLRFGDGAVALIARGAPAGGMIRFTIDVWQDSGAIPMTVLLEPRLPGTVRGSSVDGRPAELTARAAGGCTVLPVQLVLDDRRTLQVDVQT